MSLKCSLPVLALVLGAALPVHAATAAEPGTVTTHATARDRLPNTVADVILGVEAHAATLDEVQQRLATGSSQLLASLEQAGAEQARTQIISLQPELDPDAVRGQAPHIVGYTGHVGVAFRVEASKLGAILGAALGHGANTIDSSVLHPRETEIDGKRTALATSATRVALDEANQVAAAAGRKLGAIRSLVVDAPPSFTPMSVMVRATSQASPIATEPGDTEVTATVTVTMDLIEP